MRTLRNLFHSTVVVLTLVAASSIADAGPAELERVMSDYWAYRLAENPILATSFGVAGSNHELPRVTPADEARRLEAEYDFLARAKALDTSGFDDAALMNRDLLIWVLNDSIDARQLGLERIPFNSFSGFFTGALRASRGLRYTSVADYEDYIARLSAFPRYFDENIANMRRGIDDGFVLPRVVVDGIAPTVSAQVTEDPEDSALYDPFRDMPDGISENEQERLRAAGRSAVRDGAFRALGRLSRFLEGEYRDAATTETIGASALSRGEDYYRFQIRRYSTRSDLSPEDIHQIGLAEVKRIRAEMDTVIAETEFDGDFAEFTEFLRTDERFYASSPKELLKETAYIAKQIDYVLPGFFNTLPRTPYGVVPVPDAIAPNYTTASYNRAKRGGANGGAYWVNTFALDQRPLYELTALTLHEAVPGHHLQIALAQELADVPAFRQSLYFSAFGEGWALYTEKLGVEMGVYDDPYAHFGRLSYEMWRACRLVIDTGIHAMGWSRQQAIDFLASNTSLSRANVRAEVDRYISWPGQALSYKLGELKIWELRRHAEATLGDDFDLPTFHDQILLRGALPLSLLEERVRADIARQRSN
ncbi:MAG: DUF885 domain-containing protein [Pseudomonadota bacterium]